MDDVLYGHRGRTIVQQSKVAVIGCGYWGKNLVRNFYNLGVLAMVCDMTHTGRSTAKELAPQAEVVSSLEAALHAPVAGLIIATPAETHYDLVKQALEAGKDVFVEKPLALTYEQGAHLIRLAETYERILMVGHVLEYHPAVLALYALVQQGALGKVQAPAVRCRRARGPRLGRLPDGRAAYGTDPGWFGLARYPLRLPVVRPRGRAVRQRRAVERPRRATAG